MRISLDKKNLRGYVTLMVVIMFVPFLLLQGINLVDMSIDIVHISKNSISSNNQYIEEQTCWEEMLYYMRMNEISSIINIERPNMTCTFSVTSIETNKYRVELESHRDNYYSFSVKYLFYDDEVLKFIPLQ